MKINTRHYCFKLQSDLKVKSLVTQKCYVVDMNIRDVSNWQLQQCLVASIFF